MYKAQRPSTGLPTKTEQSDLQQALYGRNGESPVAVIAALKPRATALVYALRPVVSPWST